LKLATDIGCELVSLYFFWHNNLVLGLATHLVPPIVVSLVLICCADFEAYKNSKVGAYLRRHMTNTVEGIRFAANILMVLGAWFHQPLLIILGLIVVVMAWCSGWVRMSLLN
jgi:hypothetical protein